MKRSVLFTAVAALFLTASCAGTVTPTKREPSIRQGWDNEACFNGRASDCLSQIVIKQAVLNGVACFFADKRDRGIRVRTCGAW